MLMEMIFLRQYLNKTAIANGIACIDKRLFLYLMLLALPLLCSGQQMGSNPQLPEYIYASRMSQLDSQTPIKLDYNPQVRAYIDAYLIRRRDHLANIIARSQMYFPLFEEYLSKYNLPLELKYLAVIESALDPRAKSKSGAMGLWQFLYHAGLMLDLKVTSYQDERCDPIKSTDAACRYLSYLFQTLGDWQLALAAYNGGVGTVQKAIERSGGKKTFWELVPFMTDEMKSYVPAFIAVNYVMNFYDKHNVKPAIPEYAFDTVDTVFVNKSLSFDQVSRAASVSVDVLTKLNPSYIKSFIPYDDSPMLLVLPKANVARFIHNEPKLKPSVAPDMTGYFGESTVEPVQILHVVEAGEYLHKIAMRYNTTAEDIMKWNALTTKSIQIGQRLKVFVYRQKSPFLFIVQEKIDEEKSKVGA